MRRFGLWDSELPSIEELLARDVRNNSAWNHRYFVVFGRQDDSSNDGNSRSSPIEDAVIEREIEY